MLQRYKTPELILWTTAVLLVVLFVIQILASGVDEDDEPLHPRRGIAAHRRGLRSIRRNCW